MRGETELAAAIGERVRQERQSLHWTLDQLAGAAGVSRRMLVHVEQGTTNPSIGILLKISAALGVGLPAMVEPPAARPALITITRAGAGAVLWSGTGGGQAVLVAATKPPDVVELWDWALGPGDRYASEAHAAGTRELLRVHQGRLTVETADEAVLLSAGDAAALSGDVAHAYDNSGSELVRFSLTVFEPAVGPRSPGRASHA